MKLSTNALQRSLELLFLVFFQVVMAQNSPDQAEKSSFKRVLLVKDDSYLENAVGKIVIDSLTQKGFFVRTVRPNSLESENPGTYRITIVFNGIKSSDLTAAIKNYADAMGRAKSNLLISTVFGDAWEKNNGTVDAIAAATKSLNPHAVAEKILANVNKFIERDIRIDAEDTARH
jgi:hypothetical protein